MNNMMLTKPEKLVFRELSSDSRITTLELSRKLNISRYNINNIIRSLEQKLKLKYTLELDYKKLGFTTMHALYFKFSKKPKITTLKTLLSKSTHIQFFALTNGDFDAFAFALAKDPVEYSHLEVAFQASLLDYKTEVKSAEITKMRFGFLPISNKLLELSDIDEIYKQIILKLNENSRITILDLSKQLKMSTEAMGYYLRKIHDEKLIKRFTAVATYPIYKASFASFISYRISNKILSRIEKERNELYFKEPDYIEEANNIQAMWSAIGASQAFIMGSFNSSEECRNFIGRHNDIYKPDNPKVEYAEISNILVGNILFRNLKVKDNYDTTSWPIELK